MGRTVTSSPCAPKADERVRAEPFDAVELHVAVLLGDDPE